MFYGKWMADRAFLLVPAQAIVGEFLKTFEEFRRARSRPASASTRRWRRHGAEEKMIAKPGQSGEDARSRAMA